MVHTISKRKNLVLLACVAPAFICFAVVKLIPSISGFWYSLTNWNGINPNKNFIGLANFIEIFSSDAAFWGTFLFTLRYTLWAVLLINLTALAFAVAIESLGKTKSLFRTLFYLPNMISLIIGGYMWNFIFTQVVYHFSDVWGWAFFDRSWIGDPTWSFPAIVLVSIWGQAGYVMIIYMAALQNVPKSLHEAAYVDGAGPVRRFFSITLPMIRHAFTICLFITLNNAFQVFDVVYSLTGGGPGRATQVVALNIYEEAFGRSSRFGYATAKSLVVFLVVLLITAVQLSIMKRKEQQI